MLGASRIGAGGDGRLVSGRTPGCSANGWTYGFALALDPGGSRTGRGVAVPPSRPGQAPPGGPVVGRAAGWASSARSSGRPGAGAFAPRAGWATDSNVTRATAAALLVSGGRLATTRPAITSAMATANTMPKIRILVIRHAPTWLRTGHRWRPPRTACTSPAAPGWDYWSG